jgi:hypothetical protein
VSDLQERARALQEQIEAGTAIELELSEEQIKRYVEVVKHTAKMRAKVLGEDFHDIDFAMGAAVILFATGNNGKVPPAWIFNAMRGVPIFDHRTVEGRDA